LVISGQGGRRDVSTTSQTRVRYRTGAPVRRKRRFLWKKALVRLLTTAVVVGAALAIGTWLVGGVLRPIRMATSEQRERDRVVAEYKSLRKQNAQLRRELSDLHTPRGIERRARELGFVWPGETVLIIPDHLSKPRP
jgi:cell division protein FtsB